jgi:UDP-GlcNAc:undecaprenyl-phosphate/decaprenyl-phosphate GlcNAc-1-phosphate transferase
MAGLGALAFGVLDDLRGSGARRGLRGHLGALAHGEVTTGTVKLAGLAASGLGAALLEGGGPADVAVNAGLVAGGANLLNLFDLRPGRAIKVAALSACLIAVGASVGNSGGGTRGGDTGRTAGLAAVAGPAGAALALLPADLGEQAMLGDAGANALGALLGAAAARSLPLRARLALLAGIAALTVASEKVSFTKVIAASPPLNWLDMLGRRPAPSAGAPVPVPAPRRRLPGRHRRGGDREGRPRSGAWFSALVKTVARQEQ